MKRFFDVMVSLVLLMTIWPLIIFVFFIVKNKIGSPVFFTQLRPGLNNRPFKMIKFRTMLDERGVNGRLLPDSERLLPFGVLLRSTSFDELPELWNVLKEDMSLVGPRPLLMEYLSHYTI